jgi:hypothetical protein
MESGPESKRPLSTQEYLYPHIQALSNLKRPLAIRPQANKRPRINEPDPEILIMPSVAVNMRSVKDIVNTMWDNFTQNSTAEARLASLAEWKAIPDHGEFIKIMDDQDPIIRCKSVKLFMALMVIHGKTNQFPWESYCVLKCKQILNVIGNRSQFDGITLCIAAKFLEYGKLTCDTIQSWLLRLGLYCFVRYIKVSYRKESHMKMVIFAWKQFRECKAIYKWKHISKICDILGRLIKFQLTTQQVKSFEILPIWHDVIYNTFGNVNTYHKKNVNEFMMCGGWDSLSLGCVFVLNTPEFDDDKHLGVVVNALVIICDACIEEPIWARKIARSLFQSGIIEKLVTQKITQVSNQLKARIWYLLTWTLWAFDTSPVEFVEYIQVDKVKWIGLIEWMYKTQEMWWVMCVVEEAYDAWIRMVSVMVAAPKYLTFIVQRGFLDRMVDIRCGFCVTDYQATLIDETVHYILKYETCRNAVTEAYGNGDWMVRLQTMIDSNWGKPKDATQLLQHDLWDLADEWERKIHSSNVEK